MMAKLATKLRDVLDDVLAYLLTFFGMFISIYGKSFAEADAFRVEINAFKLAVSALLTLIIVWRQEALEPDEGGAVDKSRAGRKRRFATRMLGAFSHGVAWTSLIQLGA